MIIIVWNKVRPCIQHKLRVGIRGWFFQPVQVAAAHIPERCSWAANDASRGADLWLKCEPFFDVFQDWRSDVRETLQEQKQLQLVHAHISGARRRLVNQILGDLFVSLHKKLTTCLFEEWSAYICSRNNNIRVRLKFNHFIMLSF